MRPIKSDASPQDENKFNDKLQSVKPSAVRHLILIRHGQYNLDGVTDSDRYLTEIGRKQAAFTGERLKELKIPLEIMIRSTMTRAQETGKIISAHVANLPIENCSLIEEGAPIAPQPPIGHWHPEPHVSVHCVNLLFVRTHAILAENILFSNHSLFHLSPILVCIILILCIISIQMQQFFQDGARIEAGFRKYFHRADAKQEKDSYTLVVCHANVIRYFVCR